MIIKHFDEPRSRMIRGLTLKLFEHCLEVGFHGATGRRVVRIVVVVHGGLDVIVLARVLSPDGPHRLCGLPSAGLAVGCCAGCSAGCSAAPAGVAPGHAASPRQSVSLHATHTIRARSVGSILRSGPPLVDLITP